MKYWLTRNASPEQLVTMASEQLYFGRGAFGVGSASLVWFQVEAEHLTWAQAAMLAGMVQMPARTDPRCEAERAARRRTYVLVQLRAQAALTDTEFAQAMEEPLLPATEPCPRSAPMP